MQLHSLTPLPDVKQPTARSNGYQAYQHKDYRIKTITEETEETEEAEVVPEEPEILEIPDLAPMECVQIPGMHTAEPQLTEDMPEIPDLDSMIAEPAEIVKPVAEIEIPDDGKFTVKECRKHYHGEPSFTVPFGYREIRAGAFAALDELETLVISDTITKIGNGAFSDCEHLKSVYIPNSVTELGEDAFDGCDSLEEISIPRRFEEQSEDMFPDHVKITWLEDSDAQAAVSGDGKYTYKIREKEYDGSGILKIPEGYREIRAGACAGMEDLKELVLPESLTKICSGAFADCTGLETIAIPAGVKVLDPEAFDGCTGLKLVALPPHLEEAGRAAFPNADLFFLD